MSEEREVDIVDMTKDGEGIAKIDGLVVFVPFAIEGERVLIDNLVMKKNYATATIKQLKCVSPRRTKALCPYFGECGGCQILHFDYETQLLFKKLSLGNLFHSHNITTNIENTIPSPNQFGYRNSVQIKVDYTENDVLLGFYKRNSHELLNVENCVVCGDWFSKVRNIISAHLKKFDMQSQNVKNIFITCIENCNNLSLLINFQTLTGGITHSEILCKALKKVFANVSVWTSKQIKENTLLNYKTSSFVCGEKYIEVDYLGQSISLEPSDFFQVNTNQAKNIFNFIIDKINNIKPDIFVDLFCGAGSLSFEVAQNCGQVYGIDINSKSIEKANQKVNDLKIPNLKFFAGDCNGLVAQLQLNLFQKNNAEKLDIDKILYSDNKNEAIFDTLLRSSKQTKVAFLDPSRVGAGKNVLEFLCNQDFDKILYLSCNQYSLVKDLEILKQKYNINFIQPYDMFPQTNKIEVLVELTKKVEEFDFELKVKREAVLV